MTLTTIYRGQPALAEHVQQLVDVLTGARTEQITFAGRTLFADGTMALPSVGFKDDLDSGIYKPGPNEIAISTGANQRLLITNDVVEIVTALRLDGARVYGSFADANPNNRVVFQNLVGNGGTFITTAPSGTGTLSGIELHSASGLNAMKAQIVAQGNQLNIVAWHAGVGQAGHIVFMPGGETTFEGGRIDTYGNWLVGTGSILQTENNKRLYLPSHTGIPSGAPTSYSGLVPISIDSTNRRLYAYIGGAWRYAAFT